MREELYRGVQPGGKYIAFTFPDGVWNGTINEKTEWGFEFQESVIEREQPARWGLVRAVGPEVNDHLTDVTVKPGDYVFIEPLMYSEYQLLDDNTKVWWTDISKIMAVSDELPR